MHITYWLIGITVLISWYSFSKPDVLLRYSMHPYQVARTKQYYRFLTSGFLHVDFTHLLWNMFSFYFFGPVIEFYFATIFGAAGPYYFVIFYMLAIVASDIPTYFKYKDSPSYRCVGASGGIAAIIFASIIFQPLDDICLYAVLCFPGFILGTVYLMYSYFRGKKSNDHINHEAHLYGAIFGLVFCIVIYPASIVSFFHQLSTWRMF